MNLRVLFQSMKKEWPLWAIVALAFFLRFAGIGYGLPLAVVYDEAPFTLGALLMIKLHTVLPSLHAADFQSVLYYPPYISYTLLAPFALILGVQYMLWHGDPALFQFHILQDLSPFFITARFINIILGTLSVYLVYRIATALFRSRLAAAAAAFLLATSILHAALSMVGRHWVPVGTVFLVILFVLLRNGWSLKKRYLYAFGIAGIGVGVSSICTLAVILIGVYYLIFDAPEMRRGARDIPLLAAGSLIFFALAGMEWLLYHGGNTFIGSITLHEQKSFLGLLASPWSATSLFFFSEPVLAALAALGLALAVFREKKTAALIAGFFAAYVTIFYIFFRFDARFFVPIIPLFTLVGGYAVARLVSRRFAAVLTIALLCIPLIVAIRFSYLSVQGDTHEKAREWVLKHLKPNDRVLVYSSTLHVPTQAAAVAELRAIDGSALRKVDEADEAMNSRDVPYALNNLTSLIGSDFMKHLPQYARSHAYEYLVLEPRSLTEAGTTTKDVFASLTDNASVAARFDGFGLSMSIVDSAFREPFPVLFENRLLGPDIVIYRLH